MRSLCTLVASFFIATASFAQPKSPLQILTERPQISGLERAQVILEVTTPPQFAQGTIEFQLPPGFTVEPPSVSVIGAAGMTIRYSINIRANDLSGRSDVHTLIANFLSGAPGTPRTLVASASRSIVFVNNRIALGTYFAVGLLGVIAGYFVRLMVKVLGSVTPPTPDPTPPAGVPPDGPITKFVKGHYYVVDCSVTVVLAALVLAALIRDGKPPDSAAQWYGALIAGAALGMLTNSELITRIPVPRTV